MDRVIVHDLEGSHDPSLPRVLGWLLDTKQVRLVAHSAVSSLGPMSSGLCALTFGIKRCDTKLNKLASDLPSFYQLHTDLAAMFPNPEIQNQV